MVAIGSYTQSCSPSARLLCFLFILRMVAETLVAGQPLHLPFVALPHRKSQLCVYLQAAVDDFLGQLGICREGDVLLLHGRVDERLVDLVMVIVHADAFFQYQLHAFLPDALPELHEFGRGARSTRLYRLLPAEVLIVDVLLPLLHDALVRYVAHVFQYQQPDHTAYRLGRPLSAHYSPLKDSSKTAQAILFANRYSGCFWFSCDSRSKNSDRWSVRGAGFVYTILQVFRSKDTTFLQTTQVFQRFILLITNLLMHLRPN